MDRRNFAEFFADRRPHQLICSRVVPFGREIQKFCGLLASERAVVIDHVLQYATTIRDSSHPFTCKDLFADPPPINLARIVNTREREKESSRRRECRMTRKLSAPTLIPHGFPLRLPELLTCRVTIPG